MHPIQLSKPSITDEEVRASERVLRSGWLVAGPECRAFEEELAAALGKRHAAVVSSGTAALHLALYALCPRGDAPLLIPAFTYPATGNVAGFVGTGMPVHLADVDPQTFCVPAEVMAAWLAARRGPAMVVHQFGYPAPLPDAAVAPHDLLISDAACAIGNRAALGGRAACLSFHPRKILTTGEGGAVVSDDQALIEHIREVRAHGARAIPGREVLDFPAPGLNYRLPEVGAAVGRVQLRRLPELVEGHRERAARYRERLGGILPMQADHPERVWQTVAVVLPEGTDRPALRQRLRDEGIETQVASYGMHRLTAYQDAPVFGGVEGARGAAALPVAERLHERGLALPLHLQLSLADVDRVCEALLRGLGAEAAK